MKFDSSYRAAIEIAYKMGLQFGMQCCV